MSEYSRPDRETIYGVLAGECSSRDGFDGDFRRWVLTNADPKVVADIAKLIQAGALGKASGRQELPQETRTRLHIEGRI